MIGTGPTGPASIGSNVAASYFNDQTFGITGPGYTGTTFSYNQTAVEVGGITLVNGTQITVPKTGTYEAWYSLQSNFIGGGASQFLYIWLRINGVDAPWTNGRIEVNSNNGDQLPIVPYILSLNAGDYVEFVAEGTTGDFEGLAVTGVPGPDIPSLIVGIKEIATDIGTTGPTGPADKSFIIPHPVNKDKYLVHVCLEGPEAGVYYRGKAVINDDDEFVEITLPNYVDALAADFTINITPIYDGKVKGIYSATEVVNGTFRIYGTPGKVHWTVLGKRHDIEAEPDVNTTIVQGAGPYKWI